MTSKTRQLLETLTDGVAALIVSERWAAMLAAAAKFHSYGANNQLLILLQAPRAARVAGLRRWQSLGRQVRKGELICRVLRLRALCNSRLSAGELVDEIGQDGTHGP